MLTSYFFIFTPVEISQVHSKTVNCEMDNALWYFVKKRKWSCLKKWYISFGISRFSQFYSDIASKRIKFEIYLENQNPRVTFY